jgi:hypothetical protein
MILCSVALLYYGATSCAMLLGQSTTLQGVVVDEHHSPIGGVHVDVSIADARSLLSHATTLTTYQGAFQFTITSAADAPAKDSERYVIHLDKDGYDNSTEFSIDGESVRATAPLTLLLPHRAVISGVVSTVDGVPIRHLHVSANATSPLYDNDEVAGVEEATSITDDRGMFRLFHLPPGCYRIGLGAIASVGYETPVTSTARLSSASPQESTRVIALAPGEVRNDVTFVTSAPINGHTLNGAITGSGLTDSTSSFAITLVTTGPPDSSTIASTLVSADRSWSFHNVPPGRYQLVAYSQPSGILAFGPFINESGMKGSVPVSVESTDISDISVPVGAGASVQISATFAGSRVVDCRTLAVQLKALSLPSGTTSPQVAHLTNHCTWSQQDLLPGEYEVAVFGLPLDMYVEGSKGDGTSTKQIELHDDTHATLIVSDRSLTAIGVVDADGSSTSSPFRPLVSLIKESRVDGHLIQHVYITKQDNDGQFHINDLVPGTYLARSPQDNILSGMFGACTAESDRWTLATLRPNSSLRLHLHPN